MVNVFLRAPGEFALATTLHKEIVVLNETPRVFETSYCGCPVLQVKLLQLGINTILVTSVLELLFLVETSTNLYLVEDINFSPRFSIAQITDKEKIMNNVMNCFVDFDSQLGQEIFNQQVTALVTLPIEELVSNEHENYAVDEIVSQTMKNNFDLDCTLISSDSPLVNESRLYLVQSIIHDGGEELSFLLVGGNQEEQTEENGSFDIDIEPTQEEVIPTIPSPVSEDVNGFEEEVDY